LGSKIWGNELVGPNEKKLHLELKFRQRGPTNQRVHKPLPQGVFGKKGGDGPGTKRKPQYLTGGSFSSSWLRPKPLGNWAGTALYGI